MCRRSALWQVFPRALCDGARDISGSRTYSQMKNSRILITGGAGLVGSHIVDQLLDKDVAEIVVLDNFVRGRRENLASALSRKPVTVVVGDIRDRKLLAEIMASIDIV